MLRSPDPGAPVAAPRADVIRLVRSSDRVVPGPHTAPTGASDKNAPIACNLLGAIALLSPTWVTNHARGTDADTMTSTENDEFWEYVAARRHRLVRFAYLLTGDHGHAEDLTQSALLQAFRGWHRIETTPDAYVRRIMINLSHSWWRRLRFDLHLFGQPPEVAAASDDHAAYEQHDELWQAVLALPNGMRAVIVLRYFEDYSVADTAAVLGMSPGTVKSQAARGLRKMREHLSAEADPDSRPVFPLAKAEEMA